MASVKDLIVLSLFYQCVQSIQVDVNPASLDKIIQYFHDNVQPTTMNGAHAQYAIAITVPQNLCTNEKFNIQTVFSKKDAAFVKNHLIKREKCVLCTPSYNVIAARPNGKKEHAEHILLFPPGSSPMDKLLNNAAQKSCVIFYTYNSPCVTKCIQGADNILPGLANWKNNPEERIHVFVFEKIWQKDAWRKDMEKDLLKVDTEVPVYRCNKTDVMECQKCVDENTRKVIPYCLPKKK